MDTSSKVTTDKNLIKPNLQGINKNGQLITTFTKKWTLHNKLPPQNGQLITFTTEVKRALNYI